MTEPTSAFAIIPLTGKPPDNAIVHGSLNAVTQCVLGSKARFEAELLIARADAAAEEEREREQQEQQVMAEGIRAIADGIAELSRRLDEIERSQITRHKLDAASEATAKMQALPKNALADHTPQPSGELHALEPKDPSEHQPAATDAHVGKDRVLHIEKSRH